MIKKYIITEDEFQTIVESVKQILGYSGGVWGDKWTIECCSPDGYCTSMCVDTFIKSLRNFFIIKELEK